MPEPYRSILSITLHFLLYFTHSLFITSLEVSNSESVKKFTEEPISSL